MKTIVLVAALLAAAAAPVLAAGPSHRHHGHHRHCSAPAALEAEQAIRFMTDVMVVSSACRNTVYARFRLRNKNAIIHYQREMIRHLHGRRAFDRWNTRLANTAAMRQSTMPTAQFCQQSAPLLQEAGTLDPRGFRRLAAKKAAALRRNDGACR